MLADVCLLTVKLLSSILVYSIIGISHKALLPIDSFMVSIRYPSYFRYAYEF